MPSDPTLKGLPTAPEVTLFRILDAVIRADPVVKSAVKTVRSWQGLPSDKNPPTVGDMPFLRLTPQCSPEVPWSMESQVGTLFVNVEIAVAGYCSDDILNLWYAVKRACNPNDPATKNALVTRLQTAHAHKGLAYSAAPAFDPGGGLDGTFAATAQIKVEYRAPFYS